MRKPLQRTRDGVGQRAEIDLLSSLPGSLAIQASSHLATGHVPTRLGNRHPSIARYESPHCRDGVVARAERLDHAPRAAVVGCVPGQVRHPVAYSRTPVQDYAAPPRPGERNDEIRRWLTKEHTS